LHHAARDETRRLYNPVTDALDTLNHYCFEGKKNFSRKIRVLIAGGGTGDAAAHLAEQLPSSTFSLLKKVLEKASMIPAYRFARKKFWTIYQPCPPEIGKQLPNC
jgi:hypothetical protein